MKASDFKSGDRVFYTPFAGCEQCQLEYGVVSSINEKFVFVKFDKQLEKFGWDGTTSQSCHPADLTKVQ